MDKKNDNNIALVLTIYVYLSWHVLTIFIYFFTYMHFFLYIYFKIII